MLELLSPAGSPESVVAAVQNGADAIYLGLEGFNARRGAVNFTREEFINTVDYCHVRGCKVYVTMNTLVNDHEIAAAVEQGRFLSDAGADAVLVQDLGLASVLSAACPDLPLHASTQMSVHNLAGALQAAKLGMKRVVVARELSLSQIRFICENSPVEIETFVHGALCFCHSGQCYLSALIGRRSGNRGMCAQPCRMEYSFGNSKEPRPLSLKDNCLVGYLNELEEAGVACVKIEGRMKRPEYTAIVTKIYADAIKNHTPPSEQKLRELEMAFSRAGFTDGYLTRKNWKQYTNYQAHGTDMFGTRSEPDSDALKLFAEAKKSYSKSEVRRVPVDFYAIVRPNEPFTLAVCDDNGHRAGYTGPVPQPAANNPLTGESLNGQLYKTGGTPYIGRSLNADIRPGLFLSAGELNKARRAVLEALSEQRKTPPSRRKFGYRAPTPAVPIPRSSALNIQVLQPEQLTEQLAALLPANIYVPLEVLAAAPQSVVPFLQRGTGLTAVMPRVIADSEMQAVREMLSLAVQVGANAVMCGNIGHIDLARETGLALRGDFGLNMFNSYTVGELSALGFSTVTASFELRLAQIRDLVKSVPTEAIVYGRLPCMVSEQCIISRAAGICACNKTNTLIDRRGSAFPVVHEFGCRNVVLNSDKLFLADRSADLAAAGLWGRRLMFTTESARECIQVTERYLGRNDYTPNGYTRGLYYRGVE